MIRINPPSDELGRVNAIVGGKGRRYFVPKFAAPLSIKAVLSGTARWTTEAGSFEIGPSSCLILNDDEEYSIEIDSLQTVETFCIFFSRGFVQEAYRDAVTASEALIDDSPEGPAIEFSDRLQFDRELWDEILRARSSIEEASELDESLIRLAKRVVQLRSEVGQRIARLPSLRAATRDEIRRRLNRAVGLIHADIAGDLTLERIAREACLAPFHFHRLFTSYFGETPHAYVTRLRLQRATALLAGSDRSVIDVATECGFESLGSFTSLFTKRVGVPPGRFRKNKELDGLKPVLH